jgi:solute carrier family 25 aspartate/glutamate transporter 12/13
MSTIATAKEAVKESLLGAESEGLQLSAQVRATFEKHARQDGETGELVMGEAEFINAIAPMQEDYVGLDNCLEVEQLG